VVGREYDRGLRVNEDRLHDTDDARHLRVEMVVRDGKVLHTKKEGNMVTLVGMGEAVDDAREHGGSKLSAPDRHGCPVSIGNFAPRLAPIRPILEGGGCPSERKVVSHGSVEVVAVETAELLGERE
jgi:hypothetical protein